MSQLRNADNREKSATSILQEIDASTFRDADSHLNSDEDERSFEILELMCDSYSDTHTMIGDLGNSGGPLDPLFWPIHPTVDRLWHWRRLNGFDDESWPSDAKHSYFHDVHAKDGTVVTDSSCYGSFDVSILLPSVSESSLCPLAPVSGHAPDDVMSWKNLFDQKDHYYTNSELYDELAPGSDNLPYVYDNFEWEHCVSEGYTSDLLGTLSPTDQSTS